MMYKTTTTKMNEVIEGFMDLSPEDKEYVAEIMEKQLFEAKREKIAQRAEEAVANYKSGKVKTGTVKQLYKDLEGD